MGYFFHFSSLYPATYIVYVLTYLDFILKFKKQKFGTTMQFPEGLEDTPFKTVLALPKTARSAQTHKSISFI